MEVPLPKKTSPAGEDPAGFNARFNRGLWWLLSRLKVQDVPHIRRVIVTVLGGTVLLFGLAMVIMPGSVAVIVGGLAILGTEYAWARYLLRKGRQLASQALSRTQRIVSRRSEPAVAAPSVAEVPDGPLRPSEPLPAASRTGNLP